MAKNTTKSLLIISLFVATIFTSPALSFASAEEVIDTGDIDAEQLNNVLGDVFGMFQQFGASGEALGSVLEMMFTGFSNFTSTMKSYGVFVMNGSVITEEENQNITYGDGYAWDFEPYGAYQTPGVASEKAYFHYNETGDVNYDKTEGVSVTFIIWDRDMSFIEALDRMINAVTSAIAIQESGTSDEEKQAEAIELAVETVTYFLIHINDIISGDEVIIVNTIAFTTYQANFNVGGASNTNWYWTDNGVQTHDVSLLLDGPEKDALQVIAEAHNDDFMLYLLDENNFNQDKTQNFTRFSFDVVEVWLKNFHIEINVNAILTAVVTASQGGDGDAVLDEYLLTDIFGGLDIEFYIFTHHFQNWYLYDDSMYAGDIDPDVSILANNNKPDVIFDSVGTYEGNDVSAINGTEVTDYILFRGADWSFDEPTYLGVNLEEASSQDNFRMFWGITADDLSFRVIPLGMKDDQVNETVAPVEKMDYYTIGFEFSPSREKDINFESLTANDMGVADVKLVQKFGEWNDGAAPTTPDITGKDLTTVFMSTIFHFHLSIENEQIASTELGDDDPLLDAGNYQSESHEIQVGDGNEDNPLPLAAIDIAGPDYDQIQRGTFHTTPVVTSYPAETNIIPTVFAAYEAQGSETYVQESDSETTTGQISGVLTLEFSVLIYAVSYYSFDGSGDAITHDPTFSVYITNASPGAIAVILVVGTVALVGIAAILITKRKNTKAAL